MYESKNELDHFEEKIEKLYRFSNQDGKIRIRYNYSRSGSDLAKKSRIKFGSAMLPVMKHTVLLEIK
jgi:hypothetical protein